MSRAEEMAAALQQTIAGTPPAAEQETNGNGSTPAKRSRTPKAPTQAPTQAPAAGWNGAQPRVQITRRPLNVGLPEVLGIHRRLKQLAAAEGIDAQDAVAEAVDQWLTDRGYPRPQ